MPRVAITGMGIICALGRNVEEFWNNAIQGRSGIQKIQSVDTSKLRFQNGAEVRDFDPGVHFDGARQELLDRFAQFAVIAARQAVQDAHLVITPEQSPRIAVVTGSSLGGQTSEDTGFQELYRSEEHTSELQSPYV